MSIFKPKFQEGGQMGATPAPAPAEGGAPAEGNEMEMILQSFAEAVQTGNCELCMQAAQALLEVVAQAQGGGGAAPAPEEPVYQKCGGKMVKKTKKAKK